jgi:hypothetical protein
MFTSISQREARSRDEVFHGLSHEDLGRSRKRTDPRTDRHGESPDVIAI